MKSFADSVQVRRNINDVFDFITDFSNVEAIFEHIVNVEPAREGGVSTRRKYHQTRLIHGRQWHETVEVIAFECNTKYTLSTSIFGVDTRYDYTLEPVGSDATLVHLTKEVRGKGFGKLLLPLIHHLLTRPEHDGNHLNVLKEAAERHEKLRGECYRK